MHFFSRFNKALPSLTQGAPSLTRHVRAQSMSLPGTGSFTSGTAQTRRMSYASTPPYGLRNKPLSVTRALMRAQIQADTGKLDAKSAPRASDSWPSAIFGPKGPLSQPPIMTSTARGTPCQAILLRGIHQGDTSPASVFQNGMTAGGRWYPDSRHDLERAAQLQAGMNMTVGVRRAKVMESPTHLDVLPAGISMTSNPSVALRFGEHNSSSGERERGKAIIYAIDIRHKSDRVDHRDIPQNGTVPAEAETTWFGDVLPRCVVGYYKSADQDSPPESVYQPMKLEWVPNPNYLPLRDGKLFMDKT